MKLLKPLWRTHDKQMGCSGGGHSRRGRILSELGLIDDRFILPLEDIEFMMETNNSPLKFFELAQQFPEEFNEYVADNRPIDMFFA